MPKNVTDIPDRGWLHAAALQLAIRAKYAAESWGGVKPFLSRSLSGHPPMTETDIAAPAGAEGPDIDWSTALGIKLTWVTAAMCRQSNLASLAYRYSGLRHMTCQLHDTMYRRVLAQCRQRGPARRDLPVSELDWRTQSPETLRKQLVERPRPVVLRGLAKDSEAVRSWSFDSLLERFGQEEVLLTTDKLDGERGQLSAVQSDKVYLHNSEVLFRRHPELLDALPLDQVAAYSNMRPTYMQLFLGRKGTGTPFHTASNWNWFFNIEGRKTWYFVDPRYGFLIYPYNAVGHAAAFALCPYPDEYDRELFPAFAYCPVHQVTLEPGDVLFGPAWWWHAVKNLTDTTVGVASRWMLNGQVGTELRMIEEDYDIDRMRSWLFFAGISGWPFLHRLLRTPSPELSPDVTVREKRVRFTHLQRQLSSKKVFGLRHRF